MERPVAGEVAGGVAMSAAPTALEQSVLWMLRGGTWRIGRPGQSETLCSHIGASRRDVEAAVESLRLRGEAIVGGNEGLRLVTDPDELLEYVEARRRRTVAIYLGTRALRNAARRMKEAQDAAGGLTLWRDAA